MSRPLSPLEQQFFAAADRPSWKDLLDAVGRGDTTKVRSLLAADPGLATARDPSGVSVLLLAVYRGDGEIASLLDAARRGEIDVCEAAALGDLARLETLLDADPAAVDRSSPDGHSLLGLAAYFGHPAVVEVLLARGARVDLASQNAMRVTPLHAACATPDPEKALAMAGRLLAAGAPVDALQAGGFTALHAAAGRGQLPLVELLLAHGADPAIESDGGQRAPELAAGRGHAAVAARLRGLAAG